MNYEDVIISLKSGDVPDDLTNESHIRPNSECSESDFLSGLFKDEGKAVFKFSNGEVLLNINLAN